MGPGDLSRVLAPLPRRSDPRLVVGFETFDDAGVVMLSETLALVQTVDFFAPIVDEPFVFGQVAAANALSDVYAMGGEPVSVLNLAAFPTARLPLRVLTEILQGAQDIVHAAGAVVAGGHTVEDDELKFGLAVTGRVDPRRLLTNAAARAGDRLVLTKPIGTGLLATELKAGTLDPGARAALHASMILLNAAASRAALDAGARCATDITGFGLLGHASHVARASNVTIRIMADAVPFLPGAHAAAARGVHTGGTERNRSYLEPMVDWGAANEVVRALLLDPQTSGGLLIALPADVVPGYLSRITGAAEIGVVEPRGSHALVVA